MIVCLDSARLATRKLQHVNAPGLVRKGLKGGWKDDFMA